MFGFLLLAASMMEGTPMTDEPVRPAPEKEEKVGRLVLYSGRVQGVGFRATAAYVAEKYPAVTGYVKNLADGRVELYAEGPATTVQDFLSAVKARFKRNIDKEDIKEKGPEGKYRRFEIAY